MLQNYYKTTLSLSRNGHQNKSRVHFIFGLNASKYISEATPEVTLKLPQVLAVIALILIQNKPHKYHRTASDLPKNSVCNFVRGRVKSVVKSVV